MRNILYDLEIDFPIILRNSPYSVLVDLQSIMDFDGPCLGSNKKSEGEVIASYFFGPLKTL